MCLRLSTVVWQNDGSPGPLLIKRPSYVPFSASRSWFHGTSFTSAPKSKSFRIMLFLIPQSTAKIFRGFPSPNIWIVLVDTCATRCCWFGSVNPGQYFCFSPTSLPEMIRPGMEPCDLIFLVIARVSTRAIPGIPSWVSHSDNDIFAFQWL